LRVLNRSPVERSGPDHIPEPEPQPLDVEQTLRRLEERSRRLDEVVTLALRIPIVKRLMGLH
jgi:hypothetical protein